MQQPENEKQYERMVTAFSVADSKELMEKFALLYVMDRSYSRADICLAMKAVEIEKGW